MLFLILSESMPDQLSKSGLYWNCYTILASGFLKTIRNLYSIRLLEIYLMYENEKLVPR